MATPIALVTAVGAASLAAPRRNEVLMTLVFPLAGAALARAGASPILQRPMVPQAGIFPSELTALRAAGLVARRGARRLRRAAPPLAAQRRRADPARGRARPGDRLRHRAHRRAALRLLLREGQRRPHPRPRRLRDLHPLPARSCGRSRRPRATRASSPPCSRGSPGRSSARRSCRSASAARSRSSIPAYNEADNIGHVLDRMPAEVCGVETAVARRRRRLPRRDRRRRRRARRGRSPAT